MGPLPARRACRGLGGRIGWGYSHDRADTGVCPYTGWQALVLDEWFWWGEALGGEICPLCCVCVEVTLDEPVIGQTRGESPYRLARR